MTPAAETEGDPSVCYRHPDRTSWTLCARCGRTICPECQILTPSGVRCPECVRELGGSVQWTPVGSAAKASAVKAAKAKREREAEQRAARRPRWQRVILDFVKPGTTIPITTWTIAVVTIALWILGFFTGNLPQILLSATVAHPEWIWTYATAAFVYPAVASPLVIAVFVINIVFLLLIAPGMERSMSRGRFLSLFFAGTATASVLTVLVGGGYSGLFAGLFALFGAYLISVWSSPAIRNQLLVSLAINVLIAILFGSFFAVLGGLAGGVAAGLLFRRAESRPRSSAATPYLLLFGGIAALVVLAIVRGVATGAL
ncbi:MAG: rhomboid family intramembrane serine protease [Actinomycetota bacterium]|nr:rhomboid family intramembrane serine protease [Actinomycetota bacterium]